jgi:hypothetical protein
MRFNTQYHRPTIVYIHNSKSVGWEVFDMTNEGIKVIIQWWQGTAPFGFWFRIAGEASSPAKVRVLSNNTHYSIEYSGCATYRIILLYYYTSMYMYAGLLSMHAGSWCAWYSQYMHASLYYEYGMMLCIKKHLFPISLLLHSIPLLFDWLVCVCVCVRVVCCYMTPLKLTKLQIQERTTR